MTSAVGRGRPRRESIDESALLATRSLVDERGYEGFGMRDVADRSGASLGALYRRWTSKRELVVTALRAAGHQVDVVPSNDPEADLLRGLVGLANSLNSGARPLLAHLLAEPHSELSRAILEAKIDPFAVAHRDRLRRVIGSPPDFEERAAAGPALIILQVMTTGEPPGEDEIRNRIVPLLKSGVQKPNDTIQ
jgi:AcrR family transcriptional regulator